jgi:hypothetical protein
MKIFVQTLMTANAALFLFGAFQHLGIVIGSFWEPVILPAATVETICAISLLAGVAVLFRRSGNSRLIALISNFLAAAGVGLGTIALALGRGPRTATNDLYHRIMLILIGASVSILISWRKRLEATHN